MNSWRINKRISSHTTDFHEAKSPHTFFTFKVFCFMQYKTEFRARFDSVFGPVKLTDEREKHIFLFHPEIRSQRKYFPLTLAEPEIIRRSRFDPKAFILYRALPQKKYVAIVVKTNQRNFILTAYLTNKIQHQAL